MRLIDADALIKAIEKKEAEPSYQHTDEDWVIGLIMAEELIFEQPTVCAGCNKVVINNDRQ